MMANNATSENWKEKNKILNNFDSYKRQNTKRTSLVKKFINKLKKRWIFKCHPITIFVKWTLEV